MGVAGRAATPALAIAVGVLAVLAALPLWEKEVSYGVVVRNTTVTPAQSDITPADGLPYTRTTIKYDSYGTDIDAWLYKPLPADSAAGASGEPSAAAALAAGSAGAGEQAAVGEAASLAGEGSGSGAAAAAGSEAPLQAAAAAAAAAAAGGGARAGPHPVVIMAHGLGAQKDMGLHRFADVFARAGLGVLVFDYRTFGASGGEPRHWASPRRHVEDWRAAVAFVQGGGLGPDYDSSKVVLWGTSFAGGHVLVTAADSNVTAVVSMVPFLDGVAASRASLEQRGLGGSLRMLAAGAHDALRHAAAPLAARLGLELPPAYLKLVGRGGELAVMQLSDAELRSYFGKHPPQRMGGWQPWVLARLTLETSRYRPVTHLPRVAAPVLFVAATQDALCPLAPITAAAQQLPAHRASLLQYDSSHFDMYHGPNFERASRDMVEWVVDKLRHASS